MALTFASRQPAQFHAISRGGTAVAEGGPFLRMARMCRLTGDRRRVDAEGGKRDLPSRIGIKSLQIGTIWTESAPAAVRIRSYEDGVGRLPLNGKIDGTSRKLWTYSNVRGMALETLSAA